MDPKELKKVFDKQKAAEDARKNESFVQQAAARDRMQKEEAAGRAALKDVVLPYLKEIEKEFGSNEFSAQAETMSNYAPTSVSFKIGKDDLKYGIGVKDGVVTVWRQLPSKGRIAPPPQAYRGDEDPFIKTVADLTREKVGRLIQLAITKGKP